MNERTALARLEERPRDLRRGAILLRENDPQPELFILQRGMAMSYVLLDDGSRQILRFLHTGDMLGVSALVYRDSPETVVALTDCTVCPFDRSVMTALVTDHPRLSAIIMVMNQMEKVALTDRLAALGRTSAKARIAALLIEMHNRLRRRDQAIGNSFTLGVTQEEIGDATGLTAVHVNRMLRQARGRRADPARGQPGDAAQGDAAGTGGELHRTLRRARPALAPARALGFACSPPSPGGGLARE
ncbi:Crp/Fnr family transcriptional regulator [Sphingomonas aurantiaca]|uniref:Crp/Fnr family transcriptional regulator n=1 Tax=Sphingomonas aurantiaca TaxID=185949 RepID=UPI002FE2A87D